MRHDMDKATNKRRVSLILVHSLGFHVGATTKEVGIMGVGHTRFGVHPGKSVRELGAEAGFEAMRDAGVDQGDVGAVFVGVASGALSGQYSAAASIADELGLRGVPVLRCEAACATGSAALYAAISNVLSGLCETALVVGVESMNRQGSAAATDHLAKMSDADFEYPLGITFPGFFALMASAYMKKYSVGSEDLALVSVKNHANALRNPLAQFHREVTVEEVVNSKMVASPLHLLDCSPLTDGAAAVVVASKKVCEHAPKSPAWLRGMGSASSNNLLAERREIASVPSIRLAARKAFSESGLRPQDIDLAEVHDCFTIAEILAYEELGFAEKGQGASLLRSGETFMNGRMPVNTSGGLKAKGHPLGATGVSMVVEITKQLRGDVDAGRRVNGARIGLTQNMGLTGQYSYVYLFSS